jgi:drug/metabolite transporter superfamily protein YnfA
MSTVTSRVSGCLLILLGAWGGLVPFIGPYFGYYYGPDKTWLYNSDRLWLSVVPAAAAFLGGLIVLALPRASAFGAVLAALGGVWFVVGVPVLAVARPGSGPGAPAAAPGAMFSPATMHLLENIGFFSGVGIVIVFLAALALGRSGVTRVADGGVEAETVDAFNPAF